MRQKLDEQANDNQSLKQQISSLQNSEKTEKQQIMVAFSDYFKYTPLFVNTTNPKYMDKQADAFSRILVYLNQELVNQAQLVQSYIEIGDYLAAKSTFYQYLAAFQAHEKYLLKKYSS